VAAEAAGFRGAKNDVAGRILTVILTNYLDGTVYG
jgi:hypothetical protein